MVRLVRKAVSVGYWLGVDDVSYLVACLAVSVPFELVAVRPLTYIAYISHATGPRGKNKRMEAVRLAESATLLLARF